jgi:hypothetical protein
MLIGGASLVSDGPLGDEKWHISNSVYSYTPESPLMSERSEWKQLPSLLRPRIDPLVGVLHANTSRAVVIVAGCMFFSLCSHPFTSHRQREYMLLCVAI